MNLNKKVYDVLRKLKSPNFWTACIILKSWYGFREKSPDTQSLRKNLLGALFFQEELNGVIPKVCKQYKKA